MYCYKCGTYLEKHHIYCAICGEKIDFGQLQLQINLEQVENITTKNNSDSNNDSLKLSKVFDLLDKDDLHSDKFEETFAIEEILSDYCTKPRRLICDVASNIVNKWKFPSEKAQAYLYALLHLETIQDKYQPRTPQEIFGFTTPKVNTDSVHNKYQLKSAETIITGFLKEALKWRSPVAGELIKELEHFLEYQVPYNLRWDLYKEPDSTKIYYGMLMHYELEEFFEFIFKINSNEYEFINFNASDITFNIDPGNIVEYEIIIDNNIQTDTIRLLNADLETIDNIEKDFNEYISRNFFHLKNL